MRGWAVGGVVSVATEDGGATWDGGPTTLIEWFSVQLLDDGQQAWLVGDPLLIEATTDGGELWNQQAVTRGGGALFSVQVLSDGQRGWAVGNGGTILASTDGKTWDDQQSTVSEDLHAVQFLADRSAGWIAGAGGTILNSTNGGATWQLQISGTTEDLTSVHFQPAGQIGWAAAAGEVRPTVLQTLDGGETWQTLTYRNLPAPWVLFAAMPGLLFAFFGSLVTYRDVRRTPDTVVGIEGVASTDQPIGWDDADHLQLKPMALAISRFLRNDRTVPPLTIAITGEWGKGKSSLMNLISEDLRRHDARPVWFNAWHHQKEEHLLAALLENIRAQAIPGWWRWSGVALRAHLILRRSRNDLAALAALLFIGGLILGFLWLANEKTADLLAAAGRLPALLGGGGLTSVQGLNFLLGSLGLTGVGTVLAVLILRAARKLQAISLNPGTLMASLSQRTRVAQFRDQLGFRYRFAREFGDICRIMRQATNTGIVIMIDDLDRCRPESVLEILEAVNFLATAGPCFIFLGIDTPKVRDAVAYGFKDSVLDLSNTANNDQKSLKVDAEGLRDFADNYLKKLINIPVAVPQLQEKESRDFARATRDQSANSPWPERIRGVTRAAADWTGAGLAYAVVGFLAIQIATSLPELSNAETPTGPATATQPAADNTPGDPAATQPGDIAAAVPLQPTPTPAADEPTATAADLDSNRIASILWILAFVLTASGVYVLLRLTAPPDGPVRDTKAFRNAMELWNPAVFAANPTPRERHHNRQRFNAMRLRSEVAKLGWLDKIFGNTRQETEATTDISETTLVALGAVEALEDRQPSLMRVSPKQFDEIKFEAGVKAKLRHLNGGEAGEDTILDKFKSGFPGAWPPSQAQFARYLELAHTLDTDHT